jgi:hypothetical protein
MYASGQDHVFWRRRTPLLAWNRKLPNHALVDEHFESKSAPREVPINDHFPGAREQGAVPQTFEGLFATVAHLLAREKYHENMRNKQSYKERGL